MNAQLLLPNPYMPTDVRLMHAIEITSSNFIWGMVIAFCWKIALNRSINSGSLSVRQTAKVDRLTINNIIIWLGCYGFILQ